MVRCVCRASGAAAVVAGILFMLSTLTAGAASWVEPVDGRLRADLQVLAAYGVIDRTLTTWPVPLAAIAERLSTADPGALPPHAERSLLRVKSFIESETRARRLDLGAEMRMTADPPVIIRTFDPAARDNVDAHLSASYGFSRTDLKLRAGVIADTDTDGDVQLSFDGSRIVQGVGNLLFYAGTVDQWWGPGEVSSLILSTNARPFPKIGFMREVPRPFGWKALRWLGPWQFNMFLGRLEEERVISNPLLWGMRFSAAPVQGLELGFSRVIQICGEGRPCDGETWGKAFIGRDNEVSTPEERANQPGNQLAGWDISYSRPIGNMVGKAYLQMIAEDSDTTDIFPFQFGVQAGASVTGGLGAGRWSLNFEYADTAAREAGFAGDTRFNVFYDHFIYRTGYRYESRAIGHPLDNDGRIYSVLADYVDAGNIRYRFQYHHADVNRDGVVRAGGIHSVSARAGELNLLLAETFVPLPFGELVLSLRLDNVERFNPHTDSLTAAGELGLKVGF